MGNLKIQETKPKNMELNNLKLSQICESGFFLGFLREILKFKKIPKLCFLTTRVYKTHYKYGIKDHLNKADHKNYEQKPEN